MKAAIAAVAALGMPVMNGSPQVTHLGARNAKILSPQRYQGRRCLSLPGSCHGSRTGFGD